MKTLVRGAVTLVIAVAVAAGAVITTPMVPVAQAVSGSLFQAGNIISDANFFNSSAMGVGDIQAFFASQSCSPSDGVPCLQNYTQTTSTKPAGNCSAYTGASNESAATIVWRVAQACGISPKVLIVLMQKEQTLVTRPSAYGYRFAMGWGCPDSGSCDPNTVGFFNQVYKSAWQFRTYTKTPSSWRYKVGDNVIQYSPTASCGSSHVQIVDQATANLYNYTPYQPNAAALANMYGAGDDCSAYGNRNFWRLYWDWFGSPTDNNPMGQISNAQPVPGGIGVWGWALDGDTSNPIMVHFYLDGRMVGGYSASSPSPGLNDEFGLGDDHGFAEVISASPGLHSLCAYGINVGSGTTNTQLGCVSVTVGGNPIGGLDNVMAQPGGLEAWGWAIDPDTASPVMVHFYLDGRMVGGYLASGTRNDVGSVHPGYGSDHGFAQFVSASAGQHTLCAYAINVGSGTTNTQLGCGTIAVGGNPVGALDPVTVGLGKVSVAGWAIDPDTSDPIEVHMYMDGKMVGGYSASQASTELGGYSTFGLNHGYAATIPATAGPHVICAYGINVLSGNSNTQLGCQPFTIGGNPQGVIGNAQPGFASIGIWGWAYDPDTAAPVMVHVYVDGVMKGGFVANQTQNDGLPADYGSDHAYGVSVPAVPGTHSVCVYAINVGYGSTNTQLGCFTTTVSGNPVGTVDNIQPVANGFGVWGVAVDPDTTAPIMVHAYLDGVMVGGFAADQPRADIATTYPGFGSAHAYGFTIPASTGSHTICVYAINVGTGDTNTQLGCVPVSR